MSELSIFVDESGDFGDYAKHSPFYVVTMVFHDQGVDISKQIEILNENLKNKGYVNVAIHTEPLIHPFPAVLIRLHRLPIRVLP